MTDESNILRLRQGDIADDASRRRSIGGPSGVQAFVVVDAGAMPSGALKFYATNMVSAIAGVEIEGQTPTLTTGAQAVAVAVLGGSPAVGDVLLARQVDGVWVARKTTSGGGACSGSLCFTVKGCGARLESGAVVTVTRHSDGAAIGTCTSDGSGQCCVPYSDAAGVRYDYSIAKTGYVTFASNVNLSCATQNLNVQLSQDVAGGWFCCGDDPTTHQPTELVAFPANIHVSIGCRCFGSITHDCVRETAVVGVITSPGACSYKFDCAFGHVAGVYEWQISYIGGNQWMASSSNWGTAGPFSSPPDNPSFTIDIADLAPGSCDGVPGEIIYDCCRCEFPVIVSL